MTQKVWIFTCPKCPQRYTSYVQLKQIPTHRCPNPQSSKVREFVLRQLPERES